MIHNDEVIDNLKIFVLHQQFTLKSIHISFFFSSFQHSYREQINDSEIISQQ
jgi:hypothetical protein